jgi:phosphoglycolate phosphatase-like HAD superfamily hydrolase
MRIVSTVLLILFTLIIPCVADDPLPSWNEGPTKQSIIDFVQKVTDKSSPDFVTVEDRIATFDNDGTLWAEKPIYFQLLFALEQVKEMAPGHPEWKTTQPFQAVLENDMKTLGAQGEKGLLEVVAATHSGMNTEDFSANVAEWFLTARHPRFKRPYNELTYLPMVELLEYLRANDFTTFIVSGGGVDFMRVVTQDAYGIPTHQVVGSSIKTKFEMKDGVATITRLPAVDFIDDKDGKPVGIHNRIGKRPIAAFGNSDGDLQMLQWTAGGDGARFCLYVHHTDAEREWAYDKDSSVGKLVEGLVEAKKNGWTVVDMKNDWKTVFSFE